MPDSSGSSRTRAGSSLIVARDLDEAIIVMHVMPPGLRRSSP
jgi:hypothetical protein